MKRSYEAPALHAVRLQAADLIATSLNADESGYGDVLGWNDGSGLQL